MAPALSAAGGIVAALLLCPGASHAASADLYLNDIQLLGSHNSYKRPMVPERMAALREADPAIAESLDYGHVPLAEQLELGLRVLELDVFYDPGGELFGRHESEDGAVSSFPVMHVQNLDDRSDCPNLLECLLVLVRWSQSHPGHLPLFVSFNAKDDVIDRPGFVRPKPFDDAAWDAFDRELRAMLDERLLTPADVFDGLRLAWPKLDDARGRFVTILDEGGDKRRRYASRWRDRAMFTTLPEGEDGAAILFVNDPLAGFDRIRELVRAGYLVRTRADADTREAREGTFERRDAAFASGAQLISTDYYLPPAMDSERPGGGANPFGTGYQVQMPGGGIARCNPVRVSETCVLDAVPVRVPADPAQD